MKGASNNVLMGFQHLKIASECFEDYVRDHRGSSLAIIFSGYCKKINWIINDFICTPGLTPELIGAVKKHLSSDLLAIPAINEKLTKLSPECLQMIEIMVDKILEGEKILFEQEN